MTNRKQFLGAFLTDRHVAALQPSSPFLIRRLLRHVDAAHARIVVELGPGEGAATRPLLQVLPKDARYLAIERNPSFVQKLTGSDPRLDVVEGDVRDLEKTLAEKNIVAADLIIASIPFTYLSKDDREKVIAVAARHLRPDGKLIVFHQYLPLILPLLRRHFSNVKTEIELLNVPPCFLFSCQNPKV